MIKLSDRTVILLLVALQLAVCLPFITAFPIALDEPFSIFWAQQNVGEMVTELNKGNNSPLHFILLHYWQKLFGISPLAVRSLSLLFSLATIPFIYRLMRKLVAKEFAILAVLIFIGSLFNHFHAMEARMYSLFIFETAVIIFLSYELIFENKQHIIWLSIVLTASLYTHYIGIILCGTAFLIGTIYLMRSNRKMLFSWIFIFIITLVLFIPGLIIFLERFSGGGQTTWVPEAQYSELYGNIIRFFNNTLTCAVILGLLVLAALINKQKKIKTIVQEILEKKSVFVLLFFLVPYLGMFVYSKLISPVFLDRYLLFTTVPLYMYVSIIAAAGFGEKIRYWAIAIIVILMMVSVNFVPNNFREPDKVAEAVHEWNKEDACILIAPPYYDLAFLYHFDKELFKTYKPGDPIPGNQSIMAIYNFEEFVSEGLIYPTIILVDDNSTFVYPDNGIYEGLSKLGSISSEKTFKGGTRVTVFSTLNLAYEKH